MNKKTLIGIGCTLIGVTFIFVICNLIANHMYEKQTIAYVEKVKSEYETKLKNANENVEKLRDKISEISKKEQESKQKTEEKNKEVAKKSEKKESAVTSKTETTDSNQKKETPKEKPKNNIQQESPELLKRERFTKLDPNFWATILYYANAYIFDVQSVTQSLIQDINISTNEIKKWVADNKKQLNNIESMLVKAEKNGIPSVCKNDYQKFKNSYYQYKKLYTNILTTQNSLGIDVSIYNKCQVILDENWAAFMRIESKLK